MRVISAGAQLMLFGQPRRYLSAKTPLPMTSVSARVRGALANFVRHGKISPSTGWLPDLTRTKLV